VSCGGDVNGDGFDDVVIGASSAWNGEVNEGQAYLFLGSATGLSDTPAWTAEPNLQAIQFGTSVALVGDVDADGYDDVAVGAVNYDGGQLDEGRVYLYLGSSSGLAATEAWTAESDQRQSMYGFTMSTAGDTNGDGHADLLVGAFRYDAGQEDEGAVFVYLGAALEEEPEPADTDEPPLDTGAAPVDTDEPVDTDADVEEVNDGEPIGEIGSCGCMGARPVGPGLTLSILVAILVRRRTERWNPT
jgi:hypothetical protein